MPRKVAFELEYRAHIRGHRPGLILEDLVSRLAAKEMVNVALSVFSFIYQIARTEEGLSVAHNYFS